MKETLEITALIMLGTFIIGMAVAFITYELGVFFDRREHLKEKRKQADF